MKREKDFKWKTKKDGDETREAIMEYLIAYWLENLCPPKIREVGAALKMSTSHVVHHYEYLEHQGKIIWHKPKDNIRRADVIPVGLMVSYEPPE